MKTLHLVIGWFVLIVFLLTGLYMGFHNPKMDEMNDGVRMLLRSRHIYILFAGLLNLMLGAYFSYRNRSWRRTFQIIGSALIVAAPFVLMGAFFREPQLVGLEASLTLSAVIALLTGTVFHLLSGFRQGADPTVVNHPEI